ncbi:hypothetical protein H072_1247 [Dactylellina haptotyla CBS 200.50]|uniref:Uncharacterized protein n=1 Tax=Dactylellina haptotyla (strain CBS 200.50) TaxID=1284197 RepID=S8AP72_DACHA|nr:hypothetical protein H072_1247 [Dactylellina haptotyla CBS 200.50]
MDQQTPPRTPVLEGSRPDDKVKKYQEALDVGELALEPVETASKAEATSAPKSQITNSPIRDSTIASTGQPVVSAEILHSKSMTRVFRLLQSANGLDKIIRTIQYTSRFLSHIMLLNDLHTTATSAAAKGIRRQFGLTRRLLRCFNNLPQINVTMKLLLERKQRMGNDVVGYILDLVEGIGYTGFGIADSLGYLPDAGIIGIPYKDIVDKTAFQFWLYALVASILGGLIKVYRYRQRLTKYRSIFPAASTAAAIEPVPTTASASVANISSKEVLQTGKMSIEMPPTPPDSPIPPTALVSVNDAAFSIVRDLEEQQLNAGLNVLGYTADIIFPLAALKFSGFSALSDGVMGFAGCISSAVGMRKAWKATA